MNHINSQNPTSTFILPPPPPKPYTGPYYALHITPPDSTPQVGPGAFRTDMKVDVWVALTICGGVFTLLTSALVVVAG